MALGYALLHPTRLERSIRKDGHNRLYDELSDAIFGAMGVGGDLGTGFEQYLDGRIRSLEGFVDGLRSWIEPNGPLGWVGGLIEGNGTLPDIGPLFDRLADTLRSVPAFKETLRAVLHELIDGLPDASSARISLFAREQFDALTEILESPLRAGRTDRSAQRGFRSAVVLRQVFGPFFEQAATLGVSFDLRRLLKDFIDRLLAAFNAPDIDRVLRVVGEFRAQFGGLLTAFTKLNASFSVSVSVSAGPQGMPPPTADQLEDLAAPHPPGHALWIIDLVTGIFTSFSALWEVIRSNNFKDREADGVFNVIGICLQFAQTLMRAAFRDAINQPISEPSYARKFLNWLVTDQGNLAYNLLFRFIGSIHDMYRGVPNWALGFAPSMLKYYSNTMNFRAIYLTARSYWYFNARKQEHATSPASLNRTIWSIWGPWWFFSSIFGLMPAWEDFTLEQGLGEPRTIVTLLLAMVIGPVAGYIVLWKVSGQNPFTEILMAPDWPTFIMVALIWTFGLILGIIIVANLESSSLGLAIAMFVLVAVIIAVPIVAMPFLFANRNDGAPNSVFLHWLIIGAGLFMGGALPYLLWWTYIDDGRDKYDYFDRLNADTSPYLLPYTSGENWMCGQGVHGLFSHYKVALDGVKNDNHYSYDFDEAEDKPTLAARGGVVISVVAGNANGTKDSNSIDIQHLSWVDGHDPGSDLERVMTTTEYIHLSQNHAWATIGQRVVQGYHLGDIDNTGRSALNHLHFNAAEYQRIVTYTDDTGAVRTEAIDVTYPLVFKDDTLRRCRNYPILTSWIPGGGHFDGKPMSMAFYESRNVEAGPVVNPVRIRLTSAGLPAHAHVIEIDRRVLGTGAVPESITVRTRDDAPTAGLAPHSHSITIAGETLRKVLGLQPPAAFVTSDTNGHTHGFEAFAGGGRAPQPALAIVNPPSGRLLATRPGPYRLVGDQLVLRVNDRVTEYFMFGAHRAAIAGDVALERSPEPGADINVAGGVIEVPIVLGVPDLTVRGGVRLMNLAVRSSGPAVAVRALPAIVIETRRRGRGARLEVTFPDSLPARTAVGTGAFDDIASIPRASLATHVDTILKNGWPDAPVGLAASVNTDGVRLTLGGNAVDVSGSSSRIARVFGGLYDAPNRRTRGTGPMPLSTGRLVIAGAVPYEVPFLGSHAEVSINPGDPAFDVTNLSAAPLVINALGVGQRVRLQLGDDAPAALARRINLQAEGVRAFVAGTSVVIQSVGGGASSVLSVSKDPTGVLGSPTPGQSPPAPASIGDSGMMSAATVVSLIDDAIARGTLPYDAAAVAPQGRIDADRLVIEAGAGHTVEIGAAVFTGSAPFSFTADGTTRQQTGALPATVALSGPGWIDVSIDGGAAVRVPLDGECARVDLPPLERMPSLGDRLILKVNDGAAQNIVFTGTEANIEEVAATIARASADVVVRIAYVASIENAFYQGGAPRLQVDATASSPGLPGLGFLRARTAIDGRPRGLGADQLAIPADFTGVTPARDNGSFVRAFSVAETPSGTGVAFEVRAEATFLVRVQHRAVGDPAVPDPLGFPGAFAAIVSTAALPATVDLRAHCREYGVDVQNASSLTVAESNFQLCGEPAMIRTLNPPELGSGITSGVVTVSVTEPGRGARDFIVDLTGLTSLDDVAHAFHRVTPAVRAWVVRPTGIASDRLHVETAGGGTGWQLRLDSAPLLLALGFGQDDVNVTGNSLQVSGRGTVANAAAVSRDDIRLALERAVACSTGSLTRALTVSADGALVVLRSLTGPVTIETEPASLRTLLNVTEAADRTTLDPGASLATDSAVIIVKVGGRTAAVAPVFGDQARVQARDDLSSLDPAANLALLKASSIRVRVNAATRTVAVVPAAVTTLEAAIEFIAGRVPEAWIGVRGGKVTFESRGSGFGHQIEVDFSAFATPDFPPTVLGFVATQLSAAFVIVDTGQGSVPSLGEIQVVGAGNTLESLLRNRAAEVASPQAIYDVEVETAAPARIRLRTHVPDWTLNQPALTVAGPGSLPFTVPGGAAGPGPVLEATYPAAQAFEPGLFVFNAAIDPAIGGTRRVSAMLAGRPARLPALGVPTAIAVLNDKGFAVTVGLTVHQVRFVADGTTPIGQLAAQIERQCGWAVRAAAGAAGLVIETVETGSAKTITLAAPAAGVPNAITNDVATGFVLGRPLPVQELGGGTVPAMDGVRIEDLQAVLTRGVLDDGGADQAAVSQRGLDPRAYEARAGAIPNFTVIASRRDGCVSAVEPVVDLGGSFGFNRSLARGPAVRGAVVLPAFTNQKTLSGTLSIQLNDNQGVTDIAAPVVVPVAFAAGQYTARDVARRIHDELWARGIGQAAAYPDGSVVVESRVNGLAGTVRIPAPNTGTSGADQTLLRELIGAAPELFDRGYPGSGFTGSLGALRNGGRSAPGAARAQATWVFQQDGGPSTVAIPIAPGDALADIQRRVDSALATTASGRIGICVLGPDDTLYVEQTGGAALMLAVDGALPLMTQPQHPGETAERAPDPAIGLRFTTNPRTIRYARDRVGNGVDGDIDDCGWVRIPLHVTNGTTLASLYFPGGHYWTAIRNDGAKTREYDASGDMIVSGGVDPGDASLAFVHRARYWVGDNIPGQMLRIVRTSGGEFLVEMLW